jgi:hypothetical protein
MADHVRGFIRRIERSNCRRCKVNKLKIPETRLVTLEKTVEKISTGAELEDALMGVEVSFAALQNVRVAVRDKEGKLSIGIMLELWKTEEDEYIVEISGKKEEPADGSRT